MAFVKDERWTVPRIPFKGALLESLGTWLLENGIETERAFGPGGIYKVDLLEKMAQEMLPVPEEKVLASTKDLIKKLSILVGVYT